MSKRFISLCIIAVIIIGFAGNIVWKKINMGSVTINVPVPYTFMLDTSDMITCTTGTCMLTLPSGSHDVLITKFGFVNYLAQVNVERGKNVELKPLLQKVLTVETKPLVTFSLPKIINPFVLKTDADGRTALAKKAGKSGKDEVIAYFARPFTSPKIASDIAGQFVWIADGKKSENDSSEKSIYRIDTKEKSRKAVFSTTKSIQAVVPSPAGSSAFIVLPDEVNIAKSDGNVAAKIQIAGLTEKNMAWDRESALYLVQHTSTEDILSRAELDNSNGFVQMKKMEEISRWSADTDVIQFIFVDEKLHELHIQGKNKAYIIKL